MESNAAGGRGGHGGASGGRGKSKKARARAKAAAASASAAAAAAAASAASAKQSGGKKAAAVEGATTPAVGKTKALKAVKAAKAVTNVETPTVNPAAGGMVTRLTRKKLAGAKSVVKPKMGTFAAAAAVAAAAPSAPTVPKKRATAKKQQQQEAIVVPSAASVDAATHEHHVQSSSELATSRTHDAAAKSIVVSLTGGKRARARKRQANSLGASDHESSGSVAAAEASTTPTPTSAPATAAHEASVHLVHPHHIVDLSKHSPGSDTTARIAFLGGASARDSAKQDSSTGSTNHQAAPTPHAENPKTTASPTARAAGVKKLKVVKKASVRAKTVGNASDAFNKAQSTKAVGVKAATTLQKAMAEGQLQPHTAKSDASTSLSAPVIAVITDRTVVSSSPALTNESGDDASRSQGAHTSADGVNGVVSKQETSTADNVKPDAVVTPENTGELSGTASGLVVSVSSMKSTPDMKQPAPAQSQQLQHQPRQNSVDLPANATPKPQCSSTTDTTEVPTAVMPTLRSVLMPAQPSTPPKSAKLLGAASSTGVSDDRSNGKREKQINTTTKVASFASSASVSQAKISVKKKEAPSQVFPGTTPAHDEHEESADGVHQESKNNIGAVDSPLIYETPLPSVPTVEELLEKQASTPVAPPPSTHSVATPASVSSFPHVKIPEPISSDKDPCEGEDDGDGVTSPATLAVRRIFSGEMKRLQAVHFERLHGISEHPTGEAKTKATTSKKRRREDDSAEGETAQIQTMTAHRPTTVKPAPASKEKPSFGIVMDSHAYVAKMMRSDPVVESTPADEPPAQLQAPVTLPSNTWGASFGFSGQAAVSNCPAPSSPRSPLASTRPLSSWFLSKGAANFVKRVSFKRDSSGFESTGSSKRQRISSAASSDLASGPGSSGGESEENPFLASLTSNAAWRSWYTPGDKKPADSLLDPIPTTQLPRELLDHPVVPMALEDDGEPSQLPNTNATATAGASTTAKTPGRASELERLEQEIRAEKRRARAFERMLLLVLQGKAASGREFEDEYGPVLSHERASRPAKRR